MSLTADRIALADQAIQRTFAAACVAWQVLPQWDVGDPGRVNVGREIRFAFDGAAPAGLPDPLFAGAAFATKQVPVRPESVGFTMTLAQATSARADALLTAVVARATDLARKVDKDILTALAKVPAGGWAKPAPGDAKSQELAKTLLDARALLEDSGYRAPTCLLADTGYHSSINRFENDVYIAPGMLMAANANSLFRSSALGDLVLLGRAQEIPHGVAAGASPGEEPVDLAVAVPPSLEVVNEGDEIELALRVRYALRVKDERGIVKIAGPAPV